MELQLQKHATESWNGTNWTEVNDLNTAGTNALMGCGATNTCSISNGVVQLVLQSKYRTLEWN